MGIGSGLKSAANATASGLQLHDDDIERIVAAIGSRSSASGFHTGDFICGVLFAAILVALFFTKIKTRFMKRQNERDAAEVLKTMDDDGIKRLFGNTDLPSWLNFPDFERVGWINTVLNQMWPFVNSAVSQQFREILAPQLRQNKPSWIASLKLFRFDLGDKPPLANSIKVYNTTGDSSREIIIDVDFSWVGAQDIQLTIRPLPKHLGPLTPAGHILSSIIRLRAGIERITINGTLRVMFKPLLGELPVLGGMQVALVGMPKFSFDVTIYGGDASIVPGLEQWLTQFMKDTVFRPYILPERYALAFTEDAEVEELRPEGILFLKVIEARHVPKMDLFSQSDAYVRIFVRHGLQLRTTIKQDNANPVWNENLKLLIHDAESQVLTCVVMDYDDYNPDDEIGRASLAISDLTPEKRHDLWLDVDLNAESAAEPHDGKNSGIIGTFINAEQKVAAQGEKLWKKLPGVRQKDRPCQLHVEATLYMLDSEDLETAVRADTAPEHPQQQTQEEPTSRVPSETTQNGDKNGEGSSTSSDDEEAGARNEAERAGNATAAPSGAHRDANGVTSPSHQGAERPESEAEAAPGGESRCQTDGDSGNGEIAEKSPESIHVREEAVDALKGGILYVKPRKADGLKRKPWYKGFFLHSHAQLEVTICGQHKSTASVVGSSPVFSETLEFLLGGHDIEKAEHQRLKIEVWDHRLHIDYFRGGCSLVLKEIIEAKRIRNTLRLTGARHGELSLEVYWIPALDAATKQAPGRKSTDKRTTE